MPYLLQIVSQSPLTAAANFPTSHPGFDGHFPDNPLLPGFLHIQLALDLLQKAHLPANLLEVSNAKFLAPILPGTPVHITILPTEISNQFYIEITSPAHSPHSTFTLTTH